LCQVKMCSLSMLLVWKLWKFNFLPYRSGGNEKYVGPFFVTYEHRRVRAPVYSYLSQWLFVDVLTDKNDINDKKLKNNNCKLSINP